MSILIGIFTLFLLLLCVFMVFVILLQKPKQDSGMGAALGGGAAETAFGAETSNVLTKTTIYCSILFFVLSFALYLGHMYTVHRAGLDDDRLPEIERGFLPDPPAEPDEEEGE